MSLGMLTVGTVVDTNDPQQMGRLRVSCPKWGDTIDTLVTDLPWATYVTPFGGMLTRGERGPTAAVTGGPVAYGMWAIPKVGATVVCVLLDGDVNERAWLGSIHAEHMAHTLPMGRYLNGGKTGPVSSTEQSIEPISTNMNTAFGVASENNFERFTRGAENQNASVKNTIIDKVPSNIADDRTSTSRTGYPKSRIRGDLVFDETEGNFDPQTYSITTPGMHAFIMDDSVKNGKIRIRSTSGNQIILDDTNERIYISSSDGKSYIEMDKTGNVEIFSERRISTHAKLGMNFTTEGDFRVSAGKGIHLRAKDDIRLDTDANLMLYAANNTDMESSGHLSINTGTKIDIQAGTSFTATAVSGVMDLRSSENMNLDGLQIHLNDDLAAPAVPTTPNHAYLTSRVPIHEPWGRISNDPSQTDVDIPQTPISLVMNMSKTSGVLVLSYTDVNANKQDLDDAAPPSLEELDPKRNDNWRR